MRIFRDKGNGVYSVPMRRSAVTNKFIPKKEQPMDPNAPIEHKPDKPERTDPTDE